MENQSSKNEVVNNEAKQRFEMSLEAEEAFVDYELDGQTIIFTHTEVPVQFEGKGVGTRLVKAALEHARTQNLRIVPACSFVALYVRRHPEYQDLVDQA